TLDQVINALPLLTWLAQTETGDLSELHLSTYRLFYRHIKSEAVSCLGDKCPLHRACLLQNIRRQANRADILVVNHALLFTDLAGDGFLLPEYKHLIIDEGHAIEDAATESFSISIAAGIILEEIKRFHVLTEEKAQELVANLRGKTFDLFDLVYKFVVANNKISYGEEIKVIISVELAEKAEWKKIEAVYQEWQGSLEKLLKEIDQLKIEEEAKALEIEGAKEKLQGILNQLAFIFDKKEKNYVRWLMANNAMPPFNCFFKAAPIKVGPFIQ
ncbi:MAG: hypothetical protein KKA19_03760, partial [Candidatus Margulisbacteria bacterium]|nr:hypothetical protein [Candidatus Margulisiibacteriota bacterium]